MLEKLQQISLLLSGINKKLLMPHLNCICISIIRQANSFQISSICSSSVEIWYFASRDKDTFPILLQEKKKERDTNQKDCVSYAIWDHVKMKSFYIILS